MTDKLPLLPFLRFRATMQHRYSQYCPNVLWASNVYFGADCSLTNDALLDKLKDFNENGVPPEEAANLIAPYFHSKIWPDVGIYVLYLDEFGYYGIGSPFSAYKIGLSDRMRKRWATLQTGTPVELRPIHIIETNTLSWTEGWLHNALRSRRIAPDQEWFVLSESDIKVLLTIDVLNKYKNPRDEARLLRLYEALNPPDTKQLGMFDE
jgi:hypothetical protein